VKYKRVPLSYTNGDGLPAIEFLAMQIDSLLAVARHQSVVLQPLPKWLDLALLALLALSSCTFFLRFRSIWAWLAYAVGGGLLLYLLGALAFRMGYLLTIVPMLLTLLLAVTLVVNNVLRSASLQNHMVELMRVLIDKLPDPIFVSDEDRRIRLVNASFCRLAMARPTDLIGKSLTVVFPNIEPAAENVSVRRGILRALDGGERSVQASVTRHQSREGQRLRVGVITAASPAQVLDLVDPQARLSQQIDVKSYLAQAFSKKAYCIVVALADIAVLSAEYGTSVAAALEQAVAIRLAQTFGESASVSRLGEGRVVVLTVTEPAHDVAADLQSKLSGAFAWPIEAEGSNFEPDLQFGFVEFKDPPQAVELMLKQAQAQMLDLLVDYRIAHQLPAMESKVV
jgi:PAS domain S-box-containing protein